MKHEPWEDPTFQQQIKDLKRCSNHKKNGRITKKKQKTRTELKNNYYNQITEEINTAAAAREVEKEVWLKCTKNGKMDQTCISRMAN